MDARQQHQPPQADKAEQIGPQSHHPAPVEREQDQHRTRRARQRDPVDAVAIESMRGAPFGAPP
nr:hypothetical protein [Escherichia coli]